MLTGAQQLKKGSTTDGGYVMQTTQVHSIGCLPFIDASPGLRTASIEGEGHIIAGIASLSRYLMQSRQLH